MSKNFQETSSNGKEQLCRWKFSEIENLLQTFYRDNHKNMVFYLHYDIIQKQCFDIFHLPHRLHQSIPRLMIKKQTIWSKTD